MFYEMAAPFVGHAPRAFAVAALALLLAAATAVMRRGAARPLWILAAAWALFGACEAEATRERADIRVDLLLTWPALCLVSAGCVAWWVVRAARGAR